MNVIGDIIRTELERTAVEVAQSLALFSDEFQQDHPAVRRDIKSRIEELRGKAEGARAEAERWLEEARIPVEEEREQMRQEIKRRAETFIEGVAALDTEARQAIEEKSKELPSDLERIAREVEQRLAPRIQALDSELRVARGELRRRLGLEPLPPEPASAEPCESLTKSAETAATGMALRLLESPQGRLFAERAIRMMREGGQRTAGHVQQLRQGTAAMQEKISSLESQIADLRKCIEDKMEARAAQ